MLLQILCANRIFSTYLNINYSSLNIHLAVNIMHRWPGNYLSLIAIVAILYFSCWLRFFCLGLYTNFPPGDFGSAINEGLVGHLEREGCSNRGKLWRSTLDVRRCFCGVVIQDENYGWNMRGRPLVKHISVHISYKIYVCMGELELNLWIYDN